MCGEGGVLQKVMDDAEWEGYVSFPLDYYKLCQNLPIFYVKIIFFVKINYIILKGCKLGTLYDVFLTQAYKNSKTIWHNLLGMEGGVSQKMILTYVEGGKGLKPLKKGWHNFWMAPKSTVYIY